MVTAMLGLDKGMPQDMSCDQLRILHGYKMAQLWQMNILTILEMSR
jgi:hypothetical protein